MATISWSKTAVAMVEFWRELFLSFCCARPVSEPNYWIIHQLLFSFIVHSGRYGIRSLYIAYLIQHVVSDWSLRSKAYWPKLIGHSCKGDLDSVRCEAHVFNVPCSLKICKQNFLVHFIPSINHSKECGITCLWHLKSLQKYDWHKENLYPI